MKIIFLDIDGILNPLTLHNSQNKGFSKIACANLQEILNKEPEAKIVISSSWRRLGLEKCKEVLKDCNIDDSKVIDVTEGNQETWKPECREPQIQKWLDDHKDVKQFVVLDDFPMPKFVKNAVKPNGYIGLTQKDAEIAIRILQNENS